MISQKTLMTILSMVALIMQVAAGAADEAPPSHAAMVRSALEKHVLPHIESLKAETAALPDVVGNVCRTGSPAARNELAHHFRDAAVAFAGADFLRFGPMLEGGLRERISFWPDPRGFLGRQLRLVLLSKDESLFKPGALGKQSAAVQGLNALEALIEDKDVPLGPSEASAYRCGLAKAIAVNVASVSAEVADKWMKPGGWKDKMLHPGPENDTYKSSEESAVEIVKSLLVGLSLTADLQLKPQIDSKVKLTPPFQKSGLQKVYFLATIASLRDLYDALDLESYLKPDKLWMKNWLSGAWRTIQSSDGAGGRAPGAARPDAPPVREAFDKLNGMRNLISNQLSTAAGLTVGFNELDGD